MLDSIISGVQTLFSDNFIKCQMSCQIVMNIFLAALRFGSLPAL